MSPDPAHHVCGRCGRDVGEGKLDPAGWCADCRAGVVRIATPVAFGAAVLVGILYLVVVTWTGLLASPNFVIFWLALGAVLVFGAFKVARRAAFDVFRARAMRKPGR